MTSVKSHMISFYGLESKTNFYRSKSHRNTRWSGTKITLTLTLLLLFFYSKTNQMHNISNLFYFGTTLYMFWTVHHQESKTVHTASGICHTGSVCTPDDGPSETCGVLFQNKINLRYCASGWFYCRNLLRCTVLQTLVLRWCFLLLLKCWVCVFQVAELCTKCWDLCYNLTINWSVWALKRCKNCTNKMLHLRDTAILYYLFTSQPLCNLFIFKKDNGKFVPLLKQAP